MRLSLLCLLVSVSLAASSSFPESIASLEDYENIAIAQLSEKHLVLVMDQKIQQIYQKTLAIVTPAFEIIQRSIMGTTESSSTPHHVTVSERTIYLITSNSLTIYDHRLYLLATYPLSNPYFTSLVWDSLLYQPIK